MPSRAAALAVTVLSLWAGCAFTQTRGGVRQASFAELDRRARAGERLSVVFYGASLTWGANATDPPLTSYRGQVAEHQHWRTKEMVKEFEGSAKRFGGNTHLSQVVRTGLDPNVEHTLGIVPVFEGSAEQELRLESLCVAGAGARVWRKE